MEVSDDAIRFTPEEARVLGCLMEKAVTTPDIYPLTFNSLLAACNQKTNRNPVVDYDEDTVAEAIEGLRGKHFAFRVDGAGSRVAKYKHRVEERMGLDAAGKALLCVLLLRGPQTAGELRARSERMHSFPTIDSVEAVIEAVQAELEFPLWRKLAPTPGQKEARFAHLLCGEVDEAAYAPPVGERSPGAAVEAAQARNERIAQLESRVEVLESELVAMRDAFAEFRKQFE